MSTPPFSSALKLLKGGPFARYMAGESISMMGTWMQQMAQGWVISGLTTSAFTLGLINFAAGIPMLALAMLGGIVADRHDKRMVLVIVMLIQAALAATLGWLIATGQVTIWHIALAGVCLGISTAFEVPAASAIVPELVSKDELPGAIAVDRAVFHATRLAGPAIGGWLIGWLGTPVAFFINAASFFALILAVMTLHPRKKGSDHEESLRQGGMRDGFLYVWNDPPTRSMIGLLATGTLFISPFFMILMPLYSRHVLQVGPSQHGILMGASGIGAVIGSMQLLAITRGRRLNYLRIATALITIAMTLLSLANGLGLALPAIILMTLGTSTLFGLANTIVQERAPDYIRGRVSAIAGLSFYGVLPFAGLVTSKLADLTNLRFAMMLGAFCFGLAALFLLARANHFRSTP